jgi:glycine C-acetyltransferase/8-amino-7-oxononanoate synthase
VVLVDELCGPPLADAARLAGAAGATVVPYRHGDVEHLAWAAAGAGARTAGGVVATEAVFARDGDLAPLPELAAACAAAGLALVVDEAHATGAMGPDGRGAVADAGLEGEVAVVLGGLGAALAAQGAFAATDAATAAVLQRAPAVAAAPPLTPPLAAAALAALDLLAEQPRRIGRLGANAEVLRAELAREGFDVAGSTTHVVPLVVGDDGTAVRIAAAARERAVHTQALVAPAVPAGTARLRLAVMATHTRAELREAARVLGRAALVAGFRPGTAMPVALAQAA